MKAVLALAVASLFTVASPLVRAESAAPSTRTSSANASQETHVHHASHGVTAEAPSAAYSATGSVTRVDKATGKVTIAHGPIAELHWPAMTMRFSVADKKLLEQLSAGKTIEFRFVQLGTDYIVTAVN